jgi:hypothetical protein
LKVSAGVAVSGYERAWFQGAHVDFTVDTPAVPMEWNDHISSLIVYRAQDGPSRPTHFVVGVDEV